MAVPTLVWCAKNPEHFDSFTPGQSVVNVNTSAIYYDSDFSSYGIELDGTGFMEASFTPQTEMTWHNYMRWGNLASFSVGTFLLKGPTGETIVSIEWGQAGWSAYYWPDNVETQLTGNYTNVVPSTSTLDIYVDLHVSNGSIIIKCGDVIWVEVKGVRTTPTTDTTIDTVRVTCNSTLEWGGDEWSVFSGYADNPRLYSIVPDAAGANSDMTGAVTDINDPRIDTTSFLSSTTGADVSTFGTGAAVSALNANYDLYQIAGLAVLNYGRTEGGGPTGMQNVVVSGATTSNSATKTLAVGFEPQLSLFATDPNTAVAWTRAAIDAVEIGVESIT